MRGEEENKDKKTIKTIQSVERALDLFECICDSGYGYKLGELAERCCLNKTTAFHLLKTLEERGYVEQSYDTQFYKLGWKTFDLFSGVYENVDILSVAMPYMKRIRELTGETVTLYYYVKVENEYKGICVGQITSDEPLKFSCRLGTRIPLHCTAAGKVRLLGYDEEMLHEQLSRMDFKKYTETTAENAEILKAELELIREKGYCIEKEEYTPGICTVAVPMFKYTGRVAYALDVSVPTARATDERMHRIADIMMNVLKDCHSYRDFIFKGSGLK